MDGQAGFVEAYCECPIETLTDRDVKGLYKKALAGEIKNFTGVSDPYEAPVNPEVVVHTGDETPEQSCARILKTLEMLGYVASRPRRRLRRRRRAGRRRETQGPGYLG